MIKNKNILIAIFITSPGNGCRKFLNRIYNEQFKILNDQNQSNPKFDSWVFCFKKWNTKAWYWVLQFAFVSRQYTVCHWFQARGFLENRYEHSLYMTNYSFIFTGYDVVVSCIKCYVTILNCNTVQHIVPFCCLPLT